MSNLQRITIKSDPFYISPGEFLTHYHEYKPLEIRKGISGFDREIALINKLKKNTNSVFINMGVNHGGYIPFQLAKNKKCTFSNIFIININEYNPLILQMNLSKFSNVHTLHTLPPASGKEFLRVERGLILASIPSNYSFILYDQDMKSNEYKSYAYDDRFLYINNNILNNFLEEFEDYINGYKLEYNNLLHLLIMVKDAGDDFANVLSANLPFIDRWTILDTGSTDNTVSIINHVMDPKKGKLYQEPFINFRDSRNRLFDLSKQDDEGECAFYIVLDDTYILNGKIRDFLTILRGDEFADSYSMYIKDFDNLYTSNRITRFHRPLRYQYTIHEILEDNQNVRIPIEWGFITDKVNKYMSDRTEKRKQNDMDRLHYELKIAKENNNEKDISRSLYYIAETYLAIKDFDNAVKYYAERAKYRNIQTTTNEFRLRPGNKHEEVYDSLYKQGTLSLYYLNKPFEECYSLLMEAFEYDPKRADPLYVIAEYYDKKGAFNSAYMYYRHAFSIPFPTDNDMNLKHRMYQYHIPKNLMSLCFKLSDYALGVECCESLLKYNPDDVQSQQWLSLFTHANKNTLFRDMYLGKKTRYTPENKKTICFVIGGGWDGWTGETLRSKGLGGSETCVVQFAEWLAKTGKYNVLVFCNCVDNYPIVYEGVIYIHLINYYEFVSKYYIDHCFINRYPEFIYMTSLNGVSNIYLVLHDLIRECDIIPLTSNLKKVVCLTNWHTQQFLTYFPQFRDRIDIMSYTIDVNLYPQTEVKQHSFIYSSFPNRGLYWLLKMFPRITEKYPDSTLNIFCDTKMSWVRKLDSDKMDEIERMIEEQPNVTNHGWVNTDTLRSYWCASHVWLYTCDFEETYCRTALQAAASKTLVVTNHKAALSETVGNRGIIIQGEPSDEKWQSMALNRILNVFSGMENVNPLIDVNYAWARSLNADSVVGEFERRYISN